MPGYGYAEAPLKIVRKWHSLIESYLFKRSYPELSANDLPHYVKPTPTGPLRMIYWLLDARRAALKQTDIEFLKFLQRRKLNFTVVLTKADKVSNQDKELTIAYIINELLKESSSISFTVLPTSSKDGYGIDEVKYAVLKHTGVITRKGEKLMYKPVVLPKQVEIVEAERKTFQEKLAEKKEEQKRKQQALKEQKENKDKGIEEPQPTETISEIVDGRMPEDPEKKKAKKKKKQILKIGELSKDNKYIQRTRYLDDTVERTETQYKRYKKVQMFSTKKGRNLTKKKRKN
jgi:GTP-binding protein EngB required for normal cell division